MSEHPPPEPVLQVERASVTLGGRPILREVDLSVHAGEVVAVLGPNGSGKSTLVKAAVGLHPLSVGRVRLFGEPLSDFRDWARLGYVPQRTTITQGVPATVGEIVAAGRMARRRVLAPARRADREAVTEALEAVGLLERRHHTVATLSGGQQQRVLMARTLAGRPELLVLDEPNAGVDLGSQEQIAQTLGERARRGATIVVVLHELGPFAHLIDRTVHLSAGRVVHDGADLGAAHGAAHGAGHGSDPEAGHGGHHRDHPRAPIGPGIQAPLDRSVGWPGGHAGDHGGH